MPKTPYAEPWKWPEAIEAFGEAELSRGVNPRTLEDWRSNQLVPEHHILKLVRARTLPLADADRSDLSTVRDAMDEIDKRAWMFFMEVLKRRKDERAVEWRAIAAVILGFMQRSGEPPSPGPVKPRRPPRKPTTNPVKRVPN